MCCRILEKLQRIVGIHVGCIGQCGIFCYSFFTAYTVYGKWKWGKQIRLKIILKTVISADIIYLALSYWVSFCILGITLYWDVMPLIPGFVG
jgi:hypothetical protein